MITGIVVLLLARQARILEFPGFSADIIKRVRTMNIKEGASECNTCSHVPDLIGGSYKRLRYMNNMKENTPFKSSQ